MYKAKECPNCKKITKNPKYCSNYCQAEYQTKVKLENGTACWQSIRPFIKKRDNYTCQICKQTKWNGESIPLTVDHMDGNSDNNSFDNLRAICPNCDAQLPTYKSKNRGNGRASRRKRYKEGKSY